MEILLLAENGEIVNYIQGIVTAACALMGIWGFVKVVKDIKATNDEEVKRRERWDKAAKTVEENATKWNEGLADVYAERKEIVKRYDERLDEQDAKIQQLFSMMVMLMKAQNSMLEALIEANIGNGDIKEMHKELNGFIAEQIGQ